MDKSENPTDSKGTSRLEAFSDGVFAIAITLLVLDIHVPEVKAGESLLQPLWQHWANYLAFLVGFFTILICWINHHYMFEYIKKSDNNLLLINGLKLLVITFTPFVTAVLSKYINTPHQGIAVSIYAFNFFLMGLAMFLICNYAYRKKYIPGSHRLAKALVQLYAFAALLSATIFVVSFATTVGALILACVMFLIFLSPKKWNAFIIRRSQRLISVANPRGQALQEAEH